MMVIYIFSLIITGVVPQFCQAIFDGINEKKTGGDVTEFEVTFSMLEIYNEQIRDLLDSKVVKGGLKCRQHPKQGFYGKLIYSLMVHTHRPFKL